MLVHLAITSLEVVEVRVRWNQLGIIIGIINMILFVGILYYCYWVVELFDGYLVSSSGQSTIVGCYNLQSLQTIQYKIMKRGITINQILVYW